MAKFPPGHSGRPAGTRNKLTGQFLEDLLAEWEEGGRAAMKIFRIEDPGGFCKAVAGLLPRQVQVGPMADLDDRELDGLIALVEQRLQPQAIIPRVITYERAPEMEAIDRERFDDIGH